MKKTLLIITLFITGVCFAQKYEGMEFYPNGKPNFFKTYKVSKGKIEIVKEVGWHKNGQKQSEETYKDGELDGLRTEWYTNGQKRYERTYKDGEIYELYTGWYENGQKSYEQTHKNGQLISSKCWDSDGNETEECN